MQLVALRYFVAVADHGSFNAAAERLGVTPSTLTRSVNTLEDDLGLTLFERSRRGVALTPGAASVLAETRRMLASLEAVTQAAEGAARGTTGELRLGVRSPPLGEPLRSMLARWRRDHPGVRDQRRVQLRPQPDVVVPGQRPAGAGSPGRPGAHALT